MRIIIVGGGKLGYELSGLLAKEKHDVVVVEKDDRRAEYLGENLDALVLHGDGSDRNILKNGNIRKANALVAMTADDKTNLLVCEIAKDFKVGIIVSRVVDSSNDPIFSKLGITACINTTVTSILAFKRVLEEPGKKLVNLVAGEKAEVIERSVSSKSPILGRKIADFSVEKFVVAGFFRGGEFKKAGPKDKVFQGDVIIIISPVEEISKVEKLF